MHSTNDIADLSTCNGTPKILDQHEVCPDRDNNARARPVTIPSIPPSHYMRPCFVPLELAYISDDVVLFGQPPSAFSQWAPSPFIVDLVDYTSS